MCLVLQTRGQHHHRQPPRRHAAPLPGSGPLRLAASVLPSLYNSVLLCPRLSTDPHQARGGHIFLFVYSASRLCCENPRTDALRGPESGTSHHLVHATARAGYLDYTAG